MASKQPRAINQHAFHPPRRDRICDACGGQLYQRTDDNPETVRNRLVTYHAQTEPLIAHYQHAGILHEIDGEDDLDEITHRLLQTMDVISPGERADTKATAPNPCSKP